MTAQTSASERTGAALRGEEHTSLLVLGTDPAVQTDVAAVVLTDRIRQVAGPLDGGHQLAGDTEAEVQEATLAGTQGLDVLLENDDAFLHLDHLDLERRHANAETRGLDEQVADAVPGFREAPLRRSQSGSQQRNLLAKAAALRRIGFRIVADLLDRLTQLVEPRPGERVGLGVLAGLQLRRRRPLQPLGRGTVGQDVVAGIRSRNRPVGVGPVRETHTAETQQCHDYQTLSHIGLLLLKGVHR